MVEYLEPIVHQPLLTDAETEVVGEPPRGPFEAAGFAVEALEWSNRPVRQTRFPFPVTDYDNERLRLFRRRYDFLEALEGGGGEIEQLLRLRQWVHRKIPAGWPVEMVADAFGILDLAAAGGTFYCSHYAMVLQAALIASGWIARHVGIDSDHTAEEPSTHHGVTDVFSSELGKWIVLDAHFDVHYEKGGMPLSPWEIAREYVADGGKSVDVRVGTGRKKVERTRKATLPGRHESCCYFWARQPFDCDPFAPPGPWRPRLELVLVGDAHQGKLWYQGAPPETRIHNSILAGRFQFTRRFADVYPDIGASHLVLAEAHRPAAVRVSVGTLTPNFDAVMAAVDDRPAGPVGPAFDWFLHEGANTLTVRTRNRFGRLGTPSSVKAVLKKKA